MPSDLAAPHDPALLRVEDLAYAFNGRPALRGVSFAIQEGEIFGLLGPNGAGKTTTLGCISGLLRAWSGRIAFAGRSFAPAERASDRAELGVVPQDLALYADLSGRENLRFFGALHGLRDPDLERAVERGLALSGLQPRARDRVRTYSGGMKRRLNLALGELHRPRLLLLDEPTVGVDPQSRNHIFESLKALRSDGRTLLYTTHYMEEAQRLCDRVAIVHEGTVADVGTPAELAARAGLPGADLEEVFLKLTGRSLRDD